LDIFEIIKQQFQKRSQKELGLLTYFARLYPNDKCGSNGLPLIPNSIRIFGRFQFLKTLIHNNLCRYIDIQRGNQERLFVIGEHYSLNLNDLLNDTYIYNLIIANNAIIVKWTHQILRAFLYLHDNSVVHRFINLKNFCVTPNGNIKVNNYGLFFMSEYGYCVDFPIVNYVTLAPECFVLDYTYGNKFDELQPNNNEQNIELNNPKSDVWAIGVILFQFLFGLSSQTETSQQKLDELLAPERIVECSLDLLENSDSMSGYEYLLSLYKIDEEKKNSNERKIKPIFLDLIKKCLTVDIIKRPTIEELNQFFESYLEKTSEFSSLLKMNKKVDNDQNGVIKLFNRRLTFNENNDEDDEEEETDHLWKRGVDEVYYLWKLAGGDFIQTLKQNGKLSSELMPIQKLPIYVCVETGYEYGKPFSDETIFDETIVPLSLTQLRTRLKSIELDAYYPMIEQFSDGDQNDLEREHRSLTNNFMNYPNNSNNISREFIETAQKQPLNIRETDIEYQFHRIITFSRLLNCYPFKKADLYKECRVDIPPIYRALSWAALLDLKPDIEKVYASINKEIITQTDRQIDVDIPRCHQYDSLMASPKAHIKLKRVLKAWIISNPHLVYWQGLDSLCAPFLYLNFNNEAFAYGCLNSFVKKYATKFFLKDNSAVIHEYLTVFSHLIAFHDPELANHFESIDFRPDLYAIPWFLTMFAHVFPLFKIFHLWDTLLLGSSSMPLCIGVSILKQLRNILLNSDFNECILLFSELPEINIAKCVSDSIDIFCWTPTSCMYREHGSISTSNSEVYSELDICPVPLDIMRNELCPRISAKDVLKLHDTKSSKIKIIDIRPASDYSQSFITDSKNIPFESINFNKLTQLSQTQLGNSNDSDPTAQLVYLLQQNKNSVKIIASSSSKLDNVVELSNLLVHLKFSKICILHNGIECFKSTKIYQKNV
jgi:TBC domain-containing protein kinase-like protein